MASLSPSINGHSQPAPTNTASPGPQSAPTTDDQQLQQQPQGQQGQGAPTSSSGSGSDMQMAALASQMQAMTMAGPYPHHPHPGHMMPMHMAYAAAAAAAAAGFPPGSMPAPTGMTYMPAGYPSVTMGYPPQHMMQQQAVPPGMQDSGKSAPAGHGAKSGGAGAAAQGAGGVSQFQPTDATPDALKTTLWMGLENWMDEGFVRNLWTSLLGGPSAPGVDQITVKMIRDKYSGNSASYCFVDFATHEQAAKCLGLNGTAMPNLPETLFRLNWASGGGIHDTKAPEYSIFVGDLGAEVNDEMLLATFMRSFPSCKTAKVVMDPATGNSRGFGFVRFLSEEDYNRSIAEMNGVVIGSRAIRVGHATPKHRHHQGGPAAGGPHSHGGHGHHSQSHHHGGHSHGQGGGFHQHRQPRGGYNNGGGSHRHSNYNSYHSGGPGGGGHFHPRGGNQPHHISPAGAAGAADPTNTTVFIGGLSHPVTEEDIRTVFASMGEITMVKIPVGKNCAFVSYTRRESAEKAIAELNGFSLGPNKVRLSWGRPNPNAQHQQQPHAWNGAPQNGAMQFPQYAYSPQYGYPPHGTSYAPPQGAYMPPQPGSEGQPPVMTPQQPPIPAQATQGSRKSASPAPTRSPARSAAQPPQNNASPKPNNNSSKAGTPSADSAGQAPQAAADGHSNQAGYGYGLW